MIKHTYKRSLRKMSKLRGMRFFLLISEITTVKSIIAVAGGSPPQKRISFDLLLFWRMAGIFVLKKKNNCK